MRTFALSVVGLVCLCLPAFAAEKGGEEAKLTSLQRFELRRLSRELGLTDEQVDKVRKVFLDANRRKSDGVRAVLTEEQAERYEQIKKKMASRSVTGPRSSVTIGGPGMSFSTGGGGGIGSLTAKELVDKAGLTQEQADEAMKVVKDYKKASRDLVQAAMKKFDFMSIPENMKALREKTLKKLKAGLNEGQKRRLDKLVEEKKKAAFKPFVVSGDGKGMDMGKLGKDLEKALGKVARKLKTAKKSLASFEPVPSLEEIRTKLGASEEEAAVLMPKIEVIRKLVVEGWKTRLARHKELAAFIEKAPADSEAIREKVEAFRAGERELRSRLALARNDLRELLTYAQEARLVVMGIMD